MTETTGNLQEALGENASLVETLAVRADAGRVRARGGASAARARRVAAAGTVPADFVG